MIQIEALESIKSDGHMLVLGDRITVSDDIAKSWCAAGWAKATNGEVETGERKAFKSTLNPAKAKHVQSVQEVTSNG